MFFGIFDHVVPRVLSASRDFNAFACQNVWFRISITRPGPDFSIKPFLKLWSEFVWVKCASRDVYARCPAVCLAGGRYSFQRRLFFGKPPFFTVFGVLRSVWKTRSKFHRLGRRPGGCFLINRPHTVTCAVTICMLLLIKMPERQQRPSILHLINLMRHLKSAWITCALRNIKAFTHQTSGWSRRRGQTGIFWWFDLRPLLVYTLYAMLMIVGLTKCLCC